MLQGFAAAYYQCDPRSAGFLPPRYQTANEWPRVLEEARGREISSVLLEELRSQNAALGESEARTRQLDRLSEPGATVVVTGQQLGLFLGPLYTLYKALTAVEWARRLEAESGRPVVPVFWLQTEDHDFDEIAVFRSVEANGDLLEIRLPSIESRRSVAHLRHDDSIELALQQLERCLIDQPAGARELERIRSRYRPGVSWIEAFTQVMADYFEAEGLLFLNPRCAAVAELAAPIHERAIRESRAIGQELAARASDLEASGFRVQVSVRPECALSFFHPDGVDEGRYRLRPEGSGYGFAGRSGTASTAEISKALEREPMRFSSSALLRPIIQDALLPTVAYVGGPGEISYFSELSPLYERFEVAMPLIVPRRHYTVVEPAVRRVLDQLGLEPTELSPARLDAVAREQMAVDPDALRTDLRTALERELDKVEPTLIQIDRGLSRSLEQTRKTIGFALERFSSRVGDAQMRSDQTLERRLSVLRTHLFPHGAPQERILGCPRLCARFGIEAFKTTLREAIEGAPGAATVVEPPPIPTGGAL